MNELQAEECSSRRMSQTSEHGGKIKVSVVTDELAKQKVRSSCMGFCGVS